MEWIKRLVRRFFRKTPNGEPMTQEEFEAGIYYNREALDDDFFDKLEEISDA